MYLLRREIPSIRSSRKPHQMTTIAPTKLRPFPNFLTTRELAAALHVPVATIYKWLATGKEPEGAAHRVGRYLLWNEAVVIDWLATRLTTKLTANV